MKRLAGLAAIVAAAALIAAPAANAADTFADQALGSDANPCTSPTSACATVGAAISKAGANDTVRVAPGVYPEQLTLANDKKVFAEPGPPGSTVLDSSSMPGVAPTVAVAAGSGATTIQGFTIRGSASAAVAPVTLESAATVRRSVFDQDSDSAPHQSVLITAGAGSPTVTANTFTDDSQGPQSAIISHSTGTPNINSNQISGFFRGIHATAGTPVIRGNVVSGVHSSGSAGQGILALSEGAALSPTIVANLIRDPTGLSIGIHAAESFGSGTTGATLRRNRVFGQSVGILIDGTSAAVSLESDLIAFAGGNGLDTKGPGAGTEGDVTATNLTSVFAISGAPIALQESHVTLDSSIVDEAISTFGTASCAITFSRGTTMVGGGNGCQNFQTTADPMFVNDFSDPGPDDYHLESASTMRNAGNPAAPPPGSLDFDGDPRQAASCTPGPSQRDIGADETRGGGCAPPDAQIDSGPAEGGTSGGSPISGRPSPTFEFSSSGFGAVFECSLDDGEFSACASPTSYFALSSGSHTFAVRARDLTGTAEQTPPVRTWTVDGAPPETEIASGPPEAGTSSASPSFGFTASEPESTFACSLDGAAFASCPATLSLAGLSEEEHRLLVRATDPFGNVDPTQAARTWRVDATPPETRIESGPADGSSSSTREATYGFSSEDGATFECSPDGAQFTPCTSPATLSNLADGSHTFAVRAVDGVGNTDQSPAIRSLTVQGSGSEIDTDPPETKIRKVKVDGDDAKVKFSSDEAKSTFQCKLDRKKFKGCSSPRRVKNLDDGRHKFKVRAIDPAGNVDPSPAKKKFQID